MNDREAKTIRDLGSERDHYKGECERLTKLLAQHLDPSDCEVCKSFAENFGCSPEAASVDCYIHQYRDESKPTIKAQLRAAQDLLWLVWDEGEDIDHESDCPQDDACECPQIALLNLAMRNYRRNP